MGINIFIYKNGQKSILSPIPVPTRSSCFFQITPLNLLKTINNLYVCDESDDSDYSTIIYKNVKPFYNTVYECMKCIDQVLDKAVAFWK